MSREMFFMVYVNIKGAVQSAHLYTVNSENFARTLFSQNFTFRESKTSRNGKITLSFIDIGKPCFSRDFSHYNMSFNAIRENKILAKISKSTVV